MGLGCGGVFGDFGVHMGAATVHPADFPAGPPERGAPMMSIDVTADRENVHFEGIEIDLTADEYRMELVQYTLAEPDLQPALEVAGAQVLAAGWTESDPAQPGDTARVFRRDPQIFGIVTMPGEDGEGVLVLGRLTPVHTNDPTPE